MYNNRFTMIEILTAIALTMVIGWMVNLAFNNTMAVNKNISATLELEAKGNLIMNAVASELHNTSQWSKILSYSNTGFFLASNTPSMGIANWGKFGNPDTEQESGYSSGGLYKIDIKQFRIQYIQETDTSGTGLPALTRRRIMAGLTLQNYLSNYVTIAGVAQYDDLRQSLADISSGLGWMIASYNIRDFRLAFSNVTFATLEPIVRARTEPVTYYGTYIDSNGSINRFINISFYMTNAPIKYYDEQTKKAEWIKSPREVSEITDTAERENQQAITERYIWVYFSRVVALR